jgi:hypothetical protein
MCIVKKNKTIIIFICILIGLFFLWTNFLWKITKSRFAGSYPCAETWNFKIKEDSLIKIIEKIKKEHPELEPPNASYPTSGQEDFGYDFIFYYNDTNEDVFTLLKPMEDSSSSILLFIALASHIDSLTPIQNIKMDQRRINQDFGYFENRREIKKFNAKIVNLIREKL